MLIYTPFNCLVCLWHTAYWRMPPVRTKCVYKWTKLFSFSWLFIHLAHWCDLFVGFELRLRFHEIRRNKNSSLNRFSPRFSFHPESNGHINTALLSVMSSFRSDHLQWTEMKAVALVPVLGANLLAFYQLQMQLLLQLFLKLQEQEAEIMVNLQIFIWSR